MQKHKEFLMDLKETVKTLHPLETKILLFINEELFTINDMINKSGLNEGQIRSAVNWLISKEIIRQEDKIITKKYIISEIGKEWANKELIEIAIYQYIKEHPLSSINDIMQNLNYDKKDIGSAFGYLNKNSQIIRDQNGSLSISDKFNTEYYQNLSNILKKYKDSLEIPEPELDQMELNTLQIASAIPLHKVLFKFKEYENFKYRITEKGQEVKTMLTKNNISGEEISQLTSEILKEKTWKNKKFREYNIDLPAPHIIIGKKHPYKEFLDLLKYKFIELGFKEMQGSIVETEFWNMDALFMPQTHPARDIHDVYYVKEPKMAKSLEEPYYTNVKKTHENGGSTQSKGWGYKFDLEKAKQLILRSQGTVLSARQLSKKPDIPGKYFAIARCFRYDKVDATHLADFFQVEGIVLSESANFPTLLGLLKTFAHEIALADQIKFVPAYFPFTEPSVELHIKHPKIGWYELGGAGIFRPEVTVPLGVKVPVIAWGLGVDRMAMMALGIDDIRDLMSRDLDLIRMKRMDI